MMDEKRLEQLAVELGRDAVERVQPDLVADRVVRRLRTEPVLRSRPWYRRAAVKAAAVAIIAFGTIVALRAAPDGAGHTVATSGTARPYAMDDLSADELGDVLDSLNLDAPMVEVMRVGFYDLDEKQLERLLVSLEGE